MSLSGQRRFEKVQFFQDCEVKLTHSSKKSKYYIVTYKDETYKFCISSHHGAYRGSLFSVVSSNKGEKKAKNVAWEMREFLKQQHETKLRVR